MTFTPNAPFGTGGAVSATVDTTVSRLGDGVQPSAPSRSTTNTQVVLASKFNILNQATQPPAKDGR